MPAELQKAQSTHPDNIDKVFNFMTIKNAQWSVDNVADFWEAMWDLSNNPKALQKHGVRTIYGDALSMQMKPGLIYTFKLNNTGQVTVETGPAI